MAGGRRSKKARTEDQSRVHTRRHVIAAACLESKRCLCVPCFWKFVVRGRATILTLETMTPSQLDPFVTTEDEEKAMRQRFYDEYSIARVTQNKKVFWVTTHSPSDRFSSLAALVFAWYNVDDSIDGETLSKRTPMSTSHGPFPPHHIAERLFVRGLKTLLSSVPPRNLLQECGARPSPSTLIIADTIIQVKWQATYGEDKPSRARYDPEVPGVVREKSKPLVEPLSLPVQYAWQFRPSEFTPVELSRTSTWVRDDHCLGGAEGPIEGTLRVGAVRKAFKVAGLNPSSIFLDIGCWFGLAMLLAKEEFQVRLAFGVEVLRQRCLQALEFFVRKDCPAYPIHLQAECLEYLDPATHVYVFSTAMGLAVMSTIKNAILMSDTVECVITDRREFLPTSHFTCAVEQTRAVMSGSKENGNFTLYVYQRASGASDGDSLVNTHNRMKQGSTHSDATFLKSASPAKRVHPVFLPGVFMERHNKCIQMGFLKSQLARMQLSNAAYTQRFFAAVKNPPPPPPISVKEAQDIVAQTIRDDEDSAAAKRSKAFPDECYIYGEVFMHSLYPLLAMYVQNGDIFIDLGCGRGRLVMLAALALPVQRSIGVELVPSRMKSLFEAISASAHPRITKCQAILGDIRRQTLEEATIVFVNNVQFGGTNLDETIMTAALNSSTVRVVVATSRFLPRVNKRSHEFSRAFAVKEHPGIETSHGVISAFVYQRS